MIAVNIPHVEDIFQMPMKLDLARSDECWGIEETLYHQIYEVDLK